MSFGEDPFGDSLRRRAVPRRKRVRTDNVARQYGGVAQIGYPRGDLPVRVTVP